MIDGNREFCQEFLTDVRVPDANRVGDVDDGWTVGTRWMFHERNAMGGGSPYVSGVRHSNVEVPGRGGQVRRPRASRRPARRPACPRPDRRARASSPGRRPRSPTASRRVCSSACCPTPSASITRLMSAMVEQRGRRPSRLEIAGAAAAGGEAGELFAAGTVVPRSPAGQHRRRHHRDGAQQHQRASARACPASTTRTRNVPYRDVPKGPPGA